MKAMALNIPDGHELLSGRSRENAVKALATAEKRGLPAASVKTHPEGYLIPLGDEKAAPKKSTAKAAAKTEEG
jgi:hypothetical protein